LFGTSLGKVGEGGCSKNFHEAMGRSKSMFKNKYGFQPEKVVLKMGKIVTY
jgi:hypothetical protein